MTAIAYDKGILAVDSCSTIGTIRSLYANKAQVLQTKQGVWLFASSGNVPVSLRLKAWMEDFIMQEERKMCLTEDEFTRRIVREYDFHQKENSKSELLVVAPSGAPFCISINGCEKLPQHQPYATGSAWEYLLGAMEAGAKPEEAVHLACIRFGDVGGPVNVYRSGYGFDRLISVDENYA